jgi:hypothetical protein
MPPAQSWEASKISIGRDPLATGLNRQSSQVGVGYKISLCFSGAAQMREYLPMTPSRCDNETIRPGHKLVGEIKGKV